jgi:gluconokinase
MSQGIPLTDVDRWDWLITLRDAAVNALSTSSTHTGVVVTCSALKRKYRDVIRVAAYNNHGVQVHFIYLHAPEQVLMARVAARQGHFMGASMVHSQFESLEVPDEHETKDVIACDCTGSLTEVEKFCLAKVTEQLNADYEGRRGGNEW